MFWDSSALVPLLVNEQCSVEMVGLLHDDRAPVAWWASPVECTSALQRREREGTLAARDLDAALRRLDKLAAALAFVQPTNPVRTRAAALLALHPLRAADSLQLSAALAWAEGLPRYDPFVCLDRRLRDAAGRQGFSVLPREDQPLIAHDAPRRRTRRGY